MGSFSSLLARFLAQPLRRSRGSPGADAQALAENLRLGDVLLTEGNSRAAALVRCISGSAWAHVSMYVGPLDEGSNPRCIVEADIAAGVRAVPLSEFKGQRTRILRPITLDDGARRHLAHWAVSRIGAPYDMRLAWALAKRLLRLTSSPLAIAQDARHFICSTLLAHAFMFVGLRIAEAPILIPRDFERAPGFEVVTDSHERAAD